MRTRRNSRPGGGKKQALVTEITPQSEDFSRWYLDVVRRAELADYSPVKGCMVIRPYGYAIWELIQQGLDRRFKATGHVNAYFPLFIPESLLMREAEHVEGFAPQVAWVTTRRRRGARGAADRPSDLRGHHRHDVREVDSVVARSADPDQPVGQRRALGEGDAAVPAHDRVPLAGRAHRARDRGRGAGRDAARSSRSTRSSCENELAMPVMDGQKSESEKFAGASRTYSIEALMGDGRALQAGTSHNLGQNFAKAFEIQFQGRDKTLQHAWTTSWGVSTRLIGGAIMTHGDDSGLILPPRVAPYQVVIVPIPRGNWQETVLPKAQRDSGGAGAQRRARDARRSRSVHARLEVRRVGDARRAAAAGDRSQGHREGAGAARAPRHAREACRRRWTG